MSNNLLSLELMQRSVASLTGNSDAMVAHGYGEKYVVVWGNCTTEIDQSWALLSLEEFEQKFATTCLAQKSSAADARALRTRILRLANYLADGEQPMASDMCAPFADLVATIYAASSISPVQMALIAVEMSRHIEAQS